MNFSLSLDGTGAVGDKLGKTAFGRCSSPKSRTRVGYQASVMKLSALTLLLFFVSVTLVMASVVGYFRPLPYITEYRYWLALGGYGILVFGIIFKGHSQ